MGSLEWQREKEKWEGKISYVETFKALRCELRKINLKKERRVKTGKMAKTKRSRQETTEHTKKNKK